MKRQLINYQLPFNYLYNLYFYLDILGLLVRCYGLTGLYAQHSHAAWV